MIWLASVIWFALLLAFLFGVALATAWLLWRRRAINAEFERRRLTAEAESDRLRLRVSSLKESEHRANDLQLELEKARADAKKVPRLTFELKHLRDRVELIDDLERELVDLRERADRADELAAELAALTSRREAGQAAEPPPTRSPSPSSPSPPSPSDDRRDDLKVIRGIGPAMERTLNEVGITTWAQLAALSPSDVHRVGERIPAFPGRIRRDRWVEQAAALVADHTDPGSAGETHPTNGNGEHGDPDGNGNGHGLDTRETNGSAGSTPPAGPGA
ncbi:MAG: hypothetical protein AAF547_21590 [Actinomycetota bacterium]